MIPIEEYFNEYTQDLHAEAGACANFIRSTFVDKMCSLVEAEGAIPDFTQTDYKHTPRGMAVDAWSYDPPFGKLTLFVADFREQPELSTLTQTDVTDGFKRLGRLMQACLTKTFVQSLEEAMPVTGLAWFILERHTTVKHLVFALLSNARLSTRVATLPDEAIAGIKTSYEIWDFERIYRIETSGREREDVEIDFAEYVDAGLPCLPAYCGGIAMKSYLVVMPATVLAQIYEKYGERLLEQNVRTFLQFRGGINKGMRNTLVNEPHMFFSYNNGLSATAEEVRCSKGDDRLLSVRNLQIVNGGQTTASIFAAGVREHAADLSKVYVQVKLSVVSPEQVDEVVPRISEYANTQNKVSAADFFSNHPFHRKVEEFSRRLWAPSPVGQVQQTHWFYERARGQYANCQAKLPSAEKRKFLIQNPKRQMFTKTDLAKLVRTFDGLPHEVSKGAQKNFSAFAGDLGKQWDRNEGHDFSELWFKRLVGKAILFRELDARILGASWYAGYKANIVTYTLAKLADLVTRNGRHIDFLKVWGLQTTPEPLSIQLMEIAAIVNTLICVPPEGKTSNASEWAKDPACWKLVREAEVPLNPHVQEYLIGQEQNSYLEKDAGRTDVIQEKIKVQTYVFEKGAAHWCKLHDWNAKHHKLTEKEAGILAVACQLPRKVPTEPQCSLLVAAEKRAQGEGFFVG